MHTTNGNRVSALRLPVEQGQVDVVKRSESGMINNPLTVSPDVTLADLDKIGRASCRERV